MPNASAAAGSRGVANRILKKLAHNPELAHEMLTQQDEDNCSALMIAIDQNQPKIALQILSILRSQLPNQPAKQGLSFQEDAALPKVTKKQLVQLLTEPKSNEINCLSMALQDLSNLRVAREIISISQAAGIAETVLLERDKSGLRKNYLTHCLDSCISGTKSRGYFAIAEQILEALSSQPGKLDELLRQRDTLGGGIIKHR